MTKVIAVLDLASFATGGPRFLIEVLKHLSKKGYEISLVTGSMDHNDLDIMNELEVINLNILDPRILPYSQPSVVMKFLSRVPSVLRKLADGSQFILHLNSHFPCIIPYILDAEIRSKASVVCSLHHLEETSQFPGVIPKIGKIIVQDILEVNGPYDAIHTVSYYSRERIKKASLVNKDKIIVIPPGIELHRYLQLPKKSEDGLFVMIGRLEHRKHYDHAIAAVKVAAYTPDLKLYIIGEGPLMSHLYNMIKRLSLENNVFLLGRVDEETKLELLSRAQALIHLGYPEGFGIVLLEALATGTPAIVYDIPPLNEVVNHGVTGLLVEKDNIKELASTLINLHKHAFNERTLRVAATKYDISNIAGRFALLYESLVT